MSRFSINKLLLATALCLLPTSVFAAWDTATLKSVESQPNGRVIVGVVLTDSSNGASLFIGDLSFDGKAFNATALAAAVQARVASLNAAVTGVKALTPGASISLATSTPVVADPAPLTSEQQFFSDLFQLQQVQAGLQAAGIDPASVSTFAELQKRVQQEFQESYVNDKGWPIR
jgi:hypothetical protein